MAPIVLIAQQRVPNFPIDSLSGHIQYRLKLDFPGVDKKKIFDVMIKWFVTNGGPNNPAIIGQDQDRSAISALLMGSCDQDYQGITKDLLTTQFELKMIVTDGEAVITISNFEVNRGGGMEQLENFRDYVARTNPGEQAAKAPLQGMTAKDNQALLGKFADRDSDMLDNINHTASAILRDARRYVKKAQKKQLI